MHMNPSGIGASESETHQRSGLLRLIDLQHYGLAVLSVAAALGVALLLQFLHFRDAGVPLLLFAVAITSWYGGTRPAVLALVLSISSFYYYFVEPVRTIYIYPSEIPFFITFVGFAALLSWFSTIRRRAEKYLRKRAEEALRRLNRELRAISNCNQTLLRATDEQSLLQEICRIVCEEAGCRLAWVGYAEHDEAKSVRPVAWTGAEEGYLASSGIRWADTDRGRGHTGEAIRSGKSCCIQDFATDPRMAPWREGLLQRGFRSGIALPLKDENDNAFGSLTIHSAQPNTFTPEEIRLLEELSGDMAFGIITLRSRAARKRAEQQVSLLSFALNNVREASLLIDDTGRIHFGNEEACRVLGCTSTQLLGMSVPDIDPEFPAGRWARRSNRFPATPWKPWQMPRGPAMCVNCKTSSSAQSFLRMGASCMSQWQS